MKLDFEYIYKFYHCLQDEESKKLFEVKMRQLIYNPNVLLEYLAEDTLRKWRVSQYDDFCKEAEGKRIIIRGAGIWGKLTYRVLSDMGMEIFGFCDNDEQKQKTGFCGKNVISENLLITDYRDSFVLVASGLYGREFYGSLLEKSFPRKNIFMPRIGSLYATTGNQYFDCPEFIPTEKEVFIDCGCFDGQTSKEFVTWCNNKYEKIIAFEPDNYMRPKVIENCKELKNFIVFPYALGKESGSQAFISTADGGSRLHQTGNCIRKVESIDNILNGERATFIKMDIEGAEIDAIRGASKTIKKYKPKLAICIYHKPEDIVEIPKTIMEIRDDYKFYIRHYTSCFYETVLYAI